RTEAHWEFDFRNFRGDDGGPMLGLKPDQCALNVLRGERYKYVHFTALPPLLFDLDRDPHELHDLTADPAYREEAL
ncbi:MAG: sulfatase, partial [Actinobacteria bacterium]|nr:sulfatase [Actinomycetota bacterium]NIS33937.1 sulfatase [Actinomycetota bacterium]NIT97162.1 sulfatase [Actinomycetota bacterium]NIU68744.1 sulfatase [Actinomycetota bacterium]NIW30593.1 sulfatase [Actinomycetota bacterium]